MNLILRTLALAGIVAGCASGDLRKDGATSAELQADMHACESMAINELPSGDPSMSDAVSIEAEQAMRRRDLAIACMRSKGWK